MAKAYVAIPYTDAEGKHEVGEEVEFPRDTDEQKLAFDTMLRYGLISKTARETEGTKAQAKK